ncbi:hypothetical protein [Helicobacter sp. T3_23-1056]
MTMLVRHCENRASDSWQSMTKKLQKSIIWRFVIVDCHANASAFARNDGNADSRNDKKQHRQNDAKPKN